MASCTIRHTTASISFKIRPTWWFVTGQMIVNNAAEYFKPASCYCLGSVQSEVKIWPHQHTLLVHVFVCNWWVVDIVFVWAYVWCSGGSINKYMKEGRWSWTGSYSPGTGVWAHISPGERLGLPLFQCQTHNRAHRTDTKKYPHRSAHQCIPGRYIKHQEDFNHQVPFILLLIRMCIS